MIPDQTSEKAEVKMYSDFKSPYAYLAFDPGMTLGQRFKRNSAANATAQITSPASVLKPRWTAQAARLQ